jgi:transposase
VPAVEEDGLAAKKKTVHASERERPQVRLARRRYRQQIVRHRANRLRLVDESGRHIALTRRYGSAVRGQRVHDAVPKNTGRNLTLLGALSCRGLEAVMTVEGATDALVFQAYGEQVLAPTRRRGDVVVMDNLSAHKGPAVAAAIAATGAQLLYLPSYSPEYSPIEHCWSKLKTLLRGSKARTREALDQALTRLIPTLTSSDAKGWFAHCGYPLH